jgi:hypothetical protein
MRIVQLAVFEAGRELFALTEDGQIFVTKMRNYASEEYPEKEEVGHRWKKVVSPKST